MIRQNQLRQHILDIFWHSFLQLVTDSLPTGVGWLQKPERKKDKKKSFKQTKKCVIADQYYQYTLWPEVSPTSGRGFLQRQGQTSRWTDGHRDSTPESTQMANVVKNIASAVNNRLSSNYYKKNNSRRLLVLSKNPLKSVNTPRSWNFEILLQTLKKKKK